MTKEDQKQKEKKIWFAGGCFWGMEALFSKIPGVLSVVSGYANGRSTTPTYEKIPFTGHAETIAVTYDQTQISLKALLCFFFRAIDPTALNRQGNDSGKQYRSGIYYEVESDFPSIREAMIREQKKYKRHLATEVGPLENFCPAEAYHQHCLGKYPP